jgi:hypothetical protein
MLLFLTIPAAKVQCGTGEAVNPPYATCPVPEQNINKFYQTFKAGKN